METYDVIVVGGGPVGCYAALKGAVLRHTVLLVDKGRAFSRISQAKAVASIPGSPGISGDDLLARGRADIRAFERAAGARLVTLAEDTEVTEARREEPYFHVRLEGDAGGREARSRVLVLATGVVDRKPGIDRFHEEGHATLSPFLHRGAVGYCVLCEGWRTKGRRVAVVGASDGAATIAGDLAAHFDAEATLLTDGEPRPAPPRVRVDERPLRGLEPAGGGVEARFATGNPLRFDIAFFALGWYKVNNELAVGLGARTTSEGYVVTDETSEVLGRDGSPIRGLYAVGDLRAGRWKQVVQGWGDADAALVAAYAHRLPE